MRLDEVCKKFSRLFPTFYDYAIRQIKLIVCWVAKGKDHTTFYLACGPDKGPVIIFIHGWPELSIIWRHQLPVFGAGISRRCARHARLRPIVGSPQMAITPGALPLPASGTMRRPGTARGNGVDATLLALPDSCITPPRKRSSTSSTQSSTHLYPDPVYREVASLIQSSDSSVCNYDDA
jgi:hypothetical protein